MINYCALKIDVQNRVGKTDCSHELDTLCNVFTNTHTRTRIYKTTYRTLHIQYNNKCLINGGYNMSGKPKYVGLLD